MTEKLLTGTLSLKQTNKTNRLCIYDFSQTYITRSPIFCVEVLLNLSIKQLETHTQHRTQHNVYTLLKSV